MIFVILNRSLDFHKYLCQVVHCSVHTNVQILQARPVSCLLKRGVGRRNFKSDKFPVFPGPFRISTAFPAFSEFSQNFGSDHFRITPASTDHLPSFLLIACLSPLTLGLGSRSHGSGKGKSHLPFQSYSPICIE